VQISRIKKIFIISLLILTTASRYLRYPQYAYDENMKNLTGLLALDVPAVYTDVSTPMTGSAPKKAAQQVASQPKVTVNF